MAPARSDSHEPEESQPLWSALTFYATLILVLVFLLPLVAVYLLYQHNVNNA